MTEPTWETIGELSDEAIDALAALLISISDQDEEKLSPDTAITEDSK